MPEDFGGKPGNGLCALNREGCAPDREGYVPNREVDAPKREVDAPKREVDAPKREMEMPKREMDAPKREGCAPDRRRYTLNREMSWLQFNGRVLEEAEDEDVPLLERLHFLSIFLTNLDEFYMVRVGRLIGKLPGRRIEADDSDSMKWKRGVSGKPGNGSRMETERNGQGNGGRMETERNGQGNGGRMETDRKHQRRIEKRLEDIYLETARLNRKKDCIYREVARQLQNRGIVERKPESLTEKEEKAAAQYYRQQVLPFLSCRIARAARPFLHLKNKRLYVAVRLQGESGKDAVGFVAIPESVPRLYILPGETFAFMRIEKMVEKWVDGLFRKDKVKERCVLSVTRSADIAISASGQEERALRHRGRHRRTGKVCSGTDNRRPGKVCSGTDSRRTGKVCSGTDNRRPRKICSGTDSRRPGKIRSGTDNRKPGSRHRSGEERQECLGPDFRERVREMLKQREILPPIRLETEGRISAEFEALLAKCAGVGRKQVFPSRTPLDLSYGYGLRDRICRETAEPLIFAPYAPRWPDDLSSGESMMAQIERKDRMLCFPYDSIEPFLCLLREAAEDPRVNSIKITVYRLAHGSEIARLLCHAAANGKQVTVLVELRARFDEEHNLFWSERLENAGCSVVYGLKHLKCHAKILSITYRQGNTVRYITQIGTGNYNEKTCRQYADFSYFSASSELGEDAARFFHNMETGNRKGTYRKLVVGPDGLKAKLLELIGEEQKKGAQGRIRIKANSLTDRRIMEKLAEASCAGVRIQLVLRGICCLRAGVPKATENIQVTGIVGRYLEHARIYCFGEGNNLKIFISSADLMTRNLRRRVEIACPVADPEKIRQLLIMFRLQMLDNVKGRWRLEDGEFRKKANEWGGIDSQKMFLAKNPAPESKISFRIKYGYGILPMGKYGVPKAADDGL